MTIISYLRTLILAIGAAEQLAEIGIDAEVIDIRTLKPLDMETIVASVKKTHRAVIVEEDWKSVGMGAEIAARIIEGAFDYLDAPIARVALAECQCLTRSRSNSLLFRRRMTLSRRLGKSWE